MSRFVMVTVAAVALVFAGTLRAEDRTVIEPVGDKPCEVTEKDTVRLTAKGISGSDIKVDITGSAKVTTKTKVVRRAGNMNEVGGVTEEYDIKPTGKGTVKVKVTVKPPNGEAKVTEYQIEVK